MLWIKAFHVIFVVTWFAGLFYLPRLFVYHCEVGDDGSHARFCVMERKLLAITTLGMTAAITLGVWLWLAYWPLQTGWLHVKLLFVLGLVTYHGWLWATVRRFARRANQRSARFYRLMNEVPALALVAIVILAIVKPSFG